MSDRTCEIPGCTKPHQARGMCGMHVSRWRAKKGPLIRPGEPFYDPAKPARAPGSRGPAPGTKAARAAQQTSQPQPAPARTQPAAVTRYPEGSPPPRDPRASPPSRPLAPEPPMPPPASPPPPPSEVIEAEGKLGIFAGPVNDPPAATVTVATSAAPAPSTEPAPPGDPVADSAHVDVAAEQAAETAEAENPSPHADPAPSPEPKGKRSPNRAKMSRGYVKIADRGFLRLDKVMFRKMMTPEDLKAFLADRALDEDEIEAVAGPLEQWMELHPELVNPGYQLVAAIGATFGTRIMESVLLYQELTDDDEGDGGSPVPDLKVVQGERVDPFKGRPLK